MEEDFTRDAWLGVLLGPNTKETPTDIGLSQANHAVQDILNALESFKKEKVAIILPVIRKSSHSDDENSDDDRPALKRKFSRETVSVPGLKVRKDKKPIRKSSKLKLEYNSDAGTIESEIKEEPKALQEVDQEDNNLEETLDLMEEKDRKIAQRSHRSNKGRHTRHDQD